MLNKNMEEIAVGIDLGTTYSCIAIYLNNKIEIIANRNGNFTTPTQVTFLDDETLIGDAAKDSAEQGDSYQNTVFCAKRLIGRTYAEWRQVRGTMAKNWPFKIVQVDNTPVFRVQIKGEKKTFTAEQISSFVLKELKTAAEDYMGKKLSKAVISVPANFNCAQRQATKEAAEMSGFEVLQLCSEPSMAGVAYDLHAKTYNERNIVVFDCGGGTTDVAVIKITSAGNYQVLATFGDMNLGGETIVNEMINDFLAKLVSEDNRDFSNDKAAVMRIRVRCEEVKKSLSTAQFSFINFDYRGFSKKRRITRAEFEAMNSKIFDDMVAVVDDALKIAELSVDDISEVVLAGGSTRIPALQNRLVEKFGKNKILKTIQPDHAIAQGAAVMAALLSGIPTSLANRQVAEICPLSLNVEGGFGQLIPVIRRGTKLPTTGETKLTTGEDNQTDLLVRVVEGERALSRDITDGHLGQIVMKDLPQRRAGQISVHIRFEVSASGILKVTVKEPVSGQIETLDIANRERVTLTVRKMLQEAEENKDADEQHRQIANALDSLQRRARDILHEEEDRNNAESESIIERCHEIIDWVKSKKNPTLTEIQARRQSFRQFVRNRRKSDIY